MRLKLCCFILKFSQILVIISTAMWKYLKSAADQNSWLKHDGKELVFWGRSNVGKSSLINALSETKIAKASATPGRTRLINYFQTNNNKIIVDLPGYGYASLNKKQQNKIVGIIDFYFKNGQNNKEVCILIDAKIGFMPIDAEMIEYLKSLNIKFSIIITKIDKANQSQKYKVKNQAMSLSNDVEVFLVSATKKIGLNDLIEFYNL